LSVFERLSIALRLGALQRFKFLW